jgi:hypothetical protein
MFLNSNKDFSPQDKIAKLKSCSLDDLMDLLHNIEECPKDYDREIIQGVYDCLYENGIMCI